MIFKTMTNTSGKTAIQPNNFVSGLFNGDLFKKQTFSLSEVLSISDVNAIKAYNEQIDNCVTSQTAFNRTMLNTSKDAQNFVAAANGNKVALDGLTKSSKAAELGMKALAMAGNMLLIYALTSAVDIIYKCATASDRLAESAARMGSEFASTKSDISDYKTKIEELYQIINDDTSSYEDTYNARQELLKIQDEMIDKFGDEADAVKLVTDAINGQTDSLDTLTQDKWQETVNAFNSDSGKGWTEKVADAFANIGHGNNFQRMIDEMENTKVTFHMIPMYGDDTYEEFSKKLKKDFDADITRSEKDDAITLSGDLDTIYKKLLNIQTLAKGMGIDDTFLDDLGNQADEAKSKLDKYQEIYSQHVLYDKIFNSEDYEKSFDEINKVYKKYQDAFASGDEESIEKAKQNYAKIVQSATEGLDDQSVIDYFNSMYPDLQEVVGGWEFEVKFKAAVDDDSDNFEKGVQDAVNKFDTVEDIKNYNPKVATDEQKNAYLQLKQYADEYGLTLDQLIDKLIQLGLLQSQSKSDLLNKLIPSKSSPTAGVASMLTDTMDSTDADEAAKWVKSLTEEEAKLANSKDFENALEEQKKKLNDASLSANDYAAALQTVKDKQNENSEEEETTLSFADINKTKSGIGGLFDKYEQNEGYLTQDEVASVLETNPEYIQYLVKVGDQYKLNEQALNDWNEANKEQKQEINNQMGGNDYLSNYSPLLDSIQNNASHPNGGVGNTNIGSQLDDLINKNKEWNTSLQNGEITTAQYFQNISNAITNSGLEDALHSLNGKFDDSTDYIEETVSVLATQLSDGLAQSTKRFEEGQTSVQDYIEEINAGSDAEKKLLASTYDLNISQETGKASLDGLSGSALEAAQSYNSLVDSQNALASTSGFVDVLSQNAEFLSQYTDEAGNLMDSIFDDSRFYDYVSNMSNSIVDFANQNTTTMSDVANWLAETAGISTEQATSIIAQGGEAVQEAVSGSLNGVQSMTSFAMSQVGTAAGNAASAVGNVLSSLGKMISSFSYKITATPFIKGKSKFDWNPKTGLDVSLPTFGFDIKGSGGKSVQSFSTSLGKAGEALNKYGASQNASAAFNNINSYKPKKTLSANKPSSYRPTYKPKSSGKSGGGSKSPSGGGSGSEKEPTKKDYDWIETLISRINRQVSNLGKTVSATYKTWSTRNNALAQELGSVNQQISAEQQAYNKYMQLANSVGLPEGYASLVRNGTIDVSTIADDDLNDKIEKYQNYYNKAIEASDAVQDLQDKLAELAKTKFDNISSDFEAQIDQIKHSTTMYQSYIDQVEAEDAIPVRSYYENMIANEQQTISRLKDEYSQLTNAMNEALNTGRIQAYSEEWYNMRASINSVDEAIQDANKSIIEYTKSMKELSKTKFNKISTAYENASGFNDHAKNMYNGLIDQADAEGRFASKDYYSALMDMEKLNIKTLTQESNDLHKSLQEAMNKGDIEEYSDDWYEMMGKINDVDEAIMDANKSLTEYGNSMRQLDWDLFDKQEEYISKIQEESDFLVDLMSNQKLYDKDTGKDTKYATAIKGLHVVNYDVYKAQAQDYAKEIEKINKDLADDPNNMKLIERKQELIKAQQDAITGANNERDAIRSLVEDGINAQLDALQKLIQRYKDALQSTADLYNYQKSISEKTSNIASIQKQINAYGGDNSEETQSKIQQLQQSLKDAKSDLEDTEYQQYLSDQEQLLDTFYDWNIHYILVRYIPKGCNVSF